MQKRRASAAFAAAVLMTAAAVAQRGRSTSSLTDLDYIEIRQLVARSAFALDTGANNGYDYADLFTADGESVGPNAKGREPLAALARGARLGSANTVHYFTNHVIEPAPEGAAGKAYLVELDFEQTRLGQSGQAQTPPAQPGQARASQVGGGVNQ